VCSSFLFLWKISCDMQIAIIGAGCSGLAALKQLKEAGMTQVVCFEQNSRIGGNWAYSPDESHSSVCETTHLISSKGMSQFSDFPMPDNYPDYPSHEQVLDYFEAYAAHFQLMPFIRLNTKVEKAIPGENHSWYLYVNGSDEPMHFDFLLIANGHHSVPRHVSFPGHFTGEYLHSHAFKNNHPFKGKRVLVVGGGNSGCDCAVECSRVSDAVYISMRRPHYIIPKFMMGRPTDTFNNTLKYIPGFLADRLRKQSLRLQMGDYEAYGLRTPNFPITSDHPTVNSELLYMLRHGKVKPKPGIREIQGKEVTFSDGTSIEVDVIIGATGYKIATPFLDPDILDYSDADRIELYLRMFHPTQPGLIFIGLVQPQGAIWPLSEAQGALVVRYIQGKWKLPDNLVRKAAEEADQIAKEFIPGKRHTIEVHFTPYLERLQMEIKAAV
jgi:cation diffusion facilitator CzcD-associated flavoprotein CzcO